MKKSVDFAYCSTLVRVTAARAADTALARAPVAATQDDATRLAASALARAAATAFLLLVRSVSTVKFSFDSKIQFRQLSLVSTVKFNFDS